ALHSMPSDAARMHGAPEDTLQRLDTNRRRTRTDERLHYLVREGHIKDRTPIDALLDALPVIENPKSDAVVHGDLHSSQMLVDETNALSGVIDWGDVHVGDPAVDFAGVHAVLPKAAHQKFLEAYGPVDPTTWAAAKGRALWHTIAVFAQAAD